MGLSEINYYIVSSQLKSKKYNTDVKLSNRGDGIRVVSFTVRLAIIRLALNVMMPQGNYWKANLMVKFLENHGFEYSIQLLTVQNHGKITLRHF